MHGEDFDEHGSRAPSVNLLNFMHRKVEPVRSHYRQASLVEVFNILILWLKKAAGVYLEGKMSGMEMEEGTIFN